jgi:xylan 1,4-beta-xylosidase
MNSIFFLLLSIIAGNAPEHPVTIGANHKQVKQDSIFLADPTIFFHDGTYYLYGTGGIPNHGFLVYASKDLKTWRGPVGKRDGYALVKSESYGSTGFWAPQVFKRGKKFYMAYTANENIAIAESDSPLGPFTQGNLHPISGEGKQIDPYVFFDKKGKVYLYHVRLTNGNRIFVAEMNDDLSDINPKTVKECITATEPWENTQHTNWPVTEGPTVLRLKNKYYLFYSANDFRNIDYAMGYAVADHPYGPWKKPSTLPVISRANLGKNGTGHGDFIKDKKGEWLYVFHTHRTNQRVSPRVTAIVKCYFRKSGKGTFRITVDTASMFYPVVTSN